MQAQSARMNQEDDSTLKCNKLKLRERKRWTMYDSVYSAKKLLTALIDVCLKRKHSDFLCRSVSTADSAVSAIPDAPLQFESNSVRLFSLHDLMTFKGSIKVISFPDFSIYCDNDFAE